MYLHDLIGPIHFVEYPPLTDRVLAQARKVRCNRFVAKVVHVRRDPLGLFK